MLVQRENFVTCCRFLLPDGSFSAVWHLLLLCSTSVSNSSILPVWCRSCPVSADTHVRCRKLWSNHDVIPLDRHMTILEKKTCNGDWWRDGRRDAFIGGARVWNIFAYDCFNFFVLLTRVEVRFDAVFHSVIYNCHFVWLYVVSVISNRFLIAFYICVVFIC